MYADLLSDSIQKSGKNFVDKLNRIGGTKKRYTYSNGYKNELSPKNKRTRRKQSGSSRHKHRVSRLLVPHKFFKGIHFRERKQTSNQQTSKQQRKR